MERSIEYTASTAAIGKNVPYSGEIWLERLDRTYNPPTAARDKTAGTRVAGSPSSATGTIEINATPADAASRAAERKRKTANMFFVKPWTTPIAPAAQW